MKRRDSRPKKRSQRNENKRIAQVGLLVQRTLEKALAKVPSLVGVRMGDSEGLCLSPRSSFNTREYLQLANKTLNENGITTEVQSVPVKEPPPMLDSIFDRQRERFRRGEKDAILVYRNWPKNNNGREDPKPRPALDLLLHCTRLQEIAEALEPHLGRELAATLVGIIANEGIAIRGALIEGEWDLMSRAYLTGKKLLNKNRPKNPNLHWDIARFIKSQLDGGNTLEMAVKRIVEEKIFGVIKHRRVIEELAKAHRSVGPSRFRSPGQPWREHENWVPKPPGRGRPKKK